MIGGGGLILPNLNHDEIPVFYMTVVFVGFRK